MPTVRAHYDEHLGPIYAWMLGDLALETRRARAELEALGLGAGGGALAIDLGAGPGVHALALAECGYAVTAIDTCAALLDQLRERDRDRAIVAKHADLSEFRAHAPEPAAVILCMGDTLTHLASRDAVARLVRDVAEALAPGGTFVATFRDYSGAAPAGTARFIPVRSDEDRILTCFLEYGDDVVTVHDLLHERTASGWTLRASAYPKLRIEPAWVVAELERHGLACAHEPRGRGMIRLVGKRPSGSGR